MKNWFTISLDRSIGRKYFRPEETVFNTRDQTGWVVRIAHDDPRVAKIGRDYRRSFERGSFSVGSVRQYTKADLAKAELFELHKFRAGCDPAGEELGTIYDESTACSICGAGASVIGPLRLALSKVSKKKDFAENYAGEKILSARAVDILAREGIVGLAPRPVFNGKSAKVPSRDWFELHVSSESAEVLAPPTWVATHPFDWDRNEYKCQNGDKLGFQIFSELTVKRPEGPLADIFLTKQYFEERRGLLRPQRRILVTPRFRQVVLENHLKGLEFEIAHFG